MVSDDICVAEVEQWAEGLAERAGHGAPDAMQRLLSTTDWDPGAVTRRRAPATTRTTDKGSPSSPSGVTGAE